MPAMALILLGTQPKLAEFLFEFLPLIGEHNRTRQDRLALEWDILKFADSLSANLQEIIQRRTNLSMGDPTQVLKRITNEVGSFNKPLTKYQRERNLAKGNYVSGPCYMCKKYEPEGKYNRTTWECSKCGTLLSFISPPPPC